MATREQGRRSTRAWRWAGLLLSALFLAAAPARGPLSPSPVDDEFYGETFSAIADLEGGDYLLLQVAISNLGPGDRRGICRLLHVDPKGKSFTNGAHYDEDEWRHEPGRLTVGPCSMTAQDGLRFFTKVGEAKELAEVSLSLSRAPTPTTPPNNRVEVDGGFYEMELLVPNAPATAKISLPGAPTRTLKGHGFVTHSRATALPSKIAKRWVRFRALGPSSQAALAAGPGARPRARLGLD